MQPVSEIIIAASKKIDVIETFIKNSQWSSWENPRISVIEVHPVESVTEFFSALRQEPRIQSHFVFTYGGIVSNLDLTPYILSLQNTKEKDVLASFLFTTQTIGTIGEYASQNHPVQSRGVLGYDYTSKRIVIADWRNTREAEANRGSTPISKGTSFSADTVRKGGICVRSDLEPCWIGICKHEFINQFNDTYEFKNLEEFIVAVLNSPSENKILAEVVTERYCRRVTTIRDIKAATGAILRRWVYPIVPDRRVTRLISPVSIANAIRNPSHDLSKQNASPPPNAGSPVPNLTRTSPTSSDYFKTQKSTQLRGGGKGKAFGGFQSSLKQSMANLEQVQVSEEQNQFHIYTALDNWTYKESSAILQSPGLHGKSVLYGKNITVEPDCEVNQSTIGRNVHIGRGCRILNTIVWDQTVIGEGTVIEDSIVGKDVQIGKNVRLCAGCVIGARNQIPDGKVYTEPTILPPKEFQKSMPKLPSFSQKSPMSMSMKGLVTKKSTTGNVQRIPKLTSMKSSNLDMVVDEADSQDDSDDIGQVDVTNTESDEEFESSDSPSDSDWVGSSDSQTSDDSETGQDEEELDEDEPEYDPTEGWTGEDANYCRQIVMQYQSYLHDKKQPESLWSELKSQSKSQEYTDEVCAANVICAMWISIGESKKDFGILKRHYRIETREEAMLAQIRDWRVELKGGANSLDNQVSLLFELDKLGRRLTLKKNLYPVILDALVRTRIVDFQAVQTYFEELKEDAEDDDFEEEEEEEDGCTKKNIFEMTQTYVLQGQPSLDESASDDELSESGESDSFDD
ncbi:hypothetical protein BLNAU_6345 [Blattamonas nauphoetae]|uniref:EIF2B subunit epsilon/gamma LbH domain-containing protein n=1 Tax=Blattamonas nauphoetae TaxID=2049346 RepID=A0ABQ9Y4D1_9EUKA|nr:hypothetical protein BLNAU_6345 [Blattamonas nauphoetae]